jgi:hypothetical protein
MMLLLKFTFLKKNLGYLFFIFFIVACSRKQNCPPCTNCNTTITYQVIKTGSDTLIIGYSKHLSGHYDGCALTEISVDPDSLFITPGTYDWKVNTIIGGFAKINGISKEKGWILKILSSSGSVLATTENKPYHEIIHPLMGAVYENGIVIKH